MNKTERRNKFIRDNPDHRVLIKTKSDIKKEKILLTGKYGARVIGLLEQKGLDYVIQNHQEEYQRLKDNNLIK